MKNSLTINKDYVQFFNQLKEHIKNSQIRAALSVNYELIKLYWHIGKQIIEKQKQTKWGSKFLEFLSIDLQNCFPGIKGFSVRKLKRMRQFAVLYPNLSITTQPVSQLPWGHILVLIQRIKDEKSRDWYTQQASAEGWHL